MTDLKPCPECGSSLLNIMIEHCSGNKIIHCMECSRYYHELELTSEDKKDQIFDKWNAFATNYKPQPKIELKPCPFCGADAEKASYKNYKAEVYYIRCSNNECRCAETKHYWNEDDAVKAWNRRASE